MIFLIAGKQNIRIKSQIKATLKGRIDELDDLNFIKYDADDLIMQELLDDLDFLPLGYDRKAVIIENCQFLTKGKKKIKKNSDVEKLLDYIASPNEATDLFFLVNTSEFELDKKNQIYLAIEKNGKIFEQEEPKDKDWPDVVRKCFEQKHPDVKIDKDAIMELANRTKGDYASLFNNAKKLALYTDHIHYDDVCLMVTRPLDDEVYNLFNFLIDNRNMDAVRLYRDLKSRNIEPVTLISNVAGQFRLLNRVSYLAKKGMNQDEIAKELNLNPIRAKILRSKSFTISQKRINETLEELYQLDLQIKSGLISDRFFAFELFLINFKRN